MKNDIEQLKSVLEPGDVILFHTKSFINWAIRTITQSYWGHAAMYIGDGFYIESIASGVYINDVSALEDADIRIYRHENMTSEKAEAVVRTIRSKSKHGYDFWAILHLLKLLVGRKRYRNDAPVGIENKFICSELIAAAYEELGLMVIDDLSYDEIIPADFDLSPNFKRIKIKKL